MVDKIFWFAKIEENNTLPVGKIVFGLIPKDKIFFVHNFMGFQHGDSVQSIEFDYQKGIYTFQYGEAKGNNKEELMKDIERINKEAQSL